MTTLVYTYNGKQTTQTMTYDDRHLMTEKIDQYGITHRYVYDDSARVTRYTQLDADGAGERVWTFAYTPS